MKETTYYAIYDIKSNKTRNKIIQILKDAGFTRIQKSVFCGVLVQQQKKDLIEKIKGVAGEEESIYLIVSCDRCFGKITIIGKGFDKEYVSGKKIVEIL